MNKTQTASSILASAGVEHMVVSSESNDASRIVNFIIESGAHFEKRSASARTVLHGIEFVFTSYASHTSLAIYSFPSEEGTHRPVVVGFSNADGAEEDAALKRLEEHIDNSESVRFNVNETLADIVATLGA